MADSIQSLRLFYCYARRDKDLRDDLDRHLSNLKRQNNIKTWYDHQIIPGTDWQQDIQWHLDSADIILLLISADFMSSDYCYSIEMQRALERHEQGKVCVIPILLRQVDWADAPFSKLQILPDGAKPVTLWSDQDNAFWNVVQGIRRTITQFKQQIRKGYFLDERNSFAGEATTSNSPHEIIEFTNNDDAYLRWIETHPHGFIISTERSKRPDYMVLHHA